MALVDLATLKTGIPQISGSGQDSYLTTLGEQAEAAIARYLGLPRTSSGALSLEESTYIDYPDGPSFDDPCVIEPRVQPVASVTAVAEDTAGDRTYAGAVSSGDYSLIDEGGRFVVFRSDGWASGRRYTRVTYVAGYTTEPDLIRAVVLLTRHMWDQRSALGVTSTANAAGSTSYSAVAESALPAHVAGLLAPFRPARSVVA